MNCLNETDPDKNAISLLIRHSDRYSHGSYGPDPPLTERGIENAVNLGKNLSSYTINKIITTDVDRCFQTASCIREGYKKYFDIDRSKTFGHLHYSDRKTAKVFLKTHGYDEFYKRIISDIDTPGVHNAVHFNKLMTAFLISNTQDTGITIFVSHDINIAYYHYSINRTVYGRFYDINYLCGLILCYGKYVAEFHNV